MVAVNPKQALSTLKSGGHSAPIIPQTFEDVQRIAIMAVKAELGTKGWKDTPESLVAKATAAIMHGMELGLSPMQALGGIAVINGKTTIYGDLLTAVLWSNGFKIKKWTDGEGDERVARARITRPDGEVIEASFSVQQAKKARLWDTREMVEKKGREGSKYMAPNDSAWFRFDQDMLEWKAVGRAVRAGASDATRGLMIREDMENPVVDITPEAPVMVQSSDDIPEIPDAEISSPTNSEPGSDTEQLSDPRGFLSKLREELEGQGDEAIRMEIWNSNEDLIDRLDPASKREAEAIFEGCA